MHNLLHPSLQKWIYNQGWRDLLPIQKASLKAVLKADSDVVISASTASGKTEAAFLPALTRVLQHPQEGLNILYISPLKALINDQYRRLQSMTKGTSIAVTPWHGDVHYHSKKTMFEEPGGIILITPESLESLFINHLSWMKQALPSLNYIIIDEFHAFLDNPRGQQLQSQLNRLENLIGRHVPRLALSATFSDHSGVAAALRPGQALSCKIITDPGNDQDQLLVQIKSYGCVTTESDSDPADNGQTPDDQQAVMSISNWSADLPEDLFRLMRGSTNLVFCNSRADTEQLSQELSALSEERHVPNEFFPHHGSLAANLRQSLEKRLIEGKLPTTAICTSTLELGIDISGVQSIAQVGPPNSVSSIRQRLGRSGRRDHKAVLRMFIPEASGPEDAYPLYEDTILASATVELLLQHWYEAPEGGQYAFSTLIQQILSVIASYGSCQARELYALLCEHGTFKLITPALFAQLLRDLGKHELLSQMKNGALTLGRSGEKLVGNWTFYAAFAVPVEFTIDYQGQILGSFPIDNELEIGTPFLLAGRAWEVVFFSWEHHRVGVKPYQGRAVPLPVNGSGSYIRDKVRECMFKLYQQQEIPVYLNRTAKTFFTQAQQSFKALNMAQRQVVEKSQALCLYPWVGDRAMQTMALMLRNMSLRAYSIHSHIELEYVSVENLREAIAAILRLGEQPPQALLKDIRFLRSEKHDHFLSRELKLLGYASRALDQRTALAAFEKINAELEARR